MKNQIINKSSFLQTAILLMLFFSIIPFNVHSINCTRIEVYKSIKIEITGTGNCVVFLPPLGCSPDLWDETIENVFSDYSCYKVFIPGFADHQPLTNPDFNKIIDEIYGFLLENKLSKITLVGHSFGGYLALRLALTDPILFDKLIIIDSYPYSAGIFQPDLPVSQAIQQSIMIENQLRALPDSLFLMQQKQIYSTMFSKPENLENIMKWISVSDKNTIAKAYQSYLSTDLRANLKEIKCNTFVIGSWKFAAPYGKDKNFVQSIFQQQYQNLVNCKIIIAENAGHFIMLDEPDWFYGQLRSFIK